MWIEYPDTNDGKAMSTLARLKRPATLSVQCSCRVIVSAAKTPVYALRNATSV